MINSSWGQCNYKKIKRVAIVRCMKLLAKNFLFMILQFSFIMSENAKYNQLISLFLASDFGWG